MKKRFIVIILLLLSFILRLFLINSVYQPLAHDGLQYHGFALGILNSGLWADSFRLYGYPFLVAIVYFFAGAGNTLAVYITQAMLDVLTGFLIYRIGTGIFKKSSIGLIAFIIYLFNPFTAIYTGVMLSEIWAIFLTTLCFYLLWQYLKKTKFLTLLAFVFILNYLVQVKPGFFFAVIIADIIILFLSIDKAISNTSRVLHIFILIVTTFLPYVYTIAGNITYFDQFSILSADNAFVRELYISLHVDKPGNYIKDGRLVYPEQVYRIYTEYSFPSNKLERKEMAGKYFKLSLKKIKSDPGEFVITRFAKMWYIWEKRILKPYIDTDFKLNSELVFWLNNLLLFSSFIGFLSFVKKYVNDRRRLLFGLFVLISGVYITISHSMTIAEERFTLPLYPIVVIFSGCSLYSIWFLIRDGFRLWKKN